MDHQQILHGLLHFHDQTEPHRLCSASYLSSGNYKILAHKTSENNR